MEPDGRPTAADLAYGFVAAFNGGALGDVAALLHADATWILRGSLPASGIWQGRRAIVEDFLPIGGRLFAPGSPHFTVRSSTAEGDRCVLELAASGRSAAGRRYENHYVLVFTARDGLVGSVHEYMDTEHWRAALLTGNDGEGTEE